MTDSNFQIIAVDNDSRELDKIRKAFDLLKTPCLPILYNEGDNIDEKYSNIRIAFFDINLGGLGNPADPLLCNIIASALKEILDKNSFNFRLELSTRILKAILTTTVLFSYHSYATCLPQQCYFLTTAVVRLLLSIKRDSFRRYRGELNALGNVSKAMNAFIML